MNFTMKKIILLILLLSCLFNLSFLCFADKIPSISSQLAPDIVPVEKEDDNGDIIKYAAIIYDTDSTGAQPGEMKAIEYVPVDELFLTPYASRNDVHYDLLTNAQNEGIPVMLEKVYGDVIKNKNDFGKLIPQFYEVAEKFYSDSKVDKEKVSYYAKDIFDLSATTHYVETVNTERNCMAIVFDMRLTDSDEVPMFALYDRETGNYSMISSDRIVRNKDNTVTVYFDNFGEVITFKRSIEPPPAVTGDSSILWLIIIALIILLLLIMLLIAKERQRKEYDGVSDRGMIGQ